MIDLTQEMVFQSTRSGGKGGQNVNKVETAVIASFAVDASQLLTDDQKILIREKLSNRLTKDGMIQVKAQTHRTQLANKAEAAARLNELVRGALQKKKARIATRASKASKEKRLESKKIKARVKEGRQKFRPGNE